MMQLHDSEGTLRMTNMADIDRLLYAEDAQERLEMLDMLQESDRLQWRMNQDDEMLRNWPAEDEN